MSKEAVKNRMTEALASLIVREESEYMDFGNPDRMISESRLELLMEMVDIVEDIFNEAG